MRTTRTSVISEMLRIERAWRPRTEREFADTVDHFDAMMTANRKASYFLIQAAARLVVCEGTTGSIVNIGSTKAHGSQPRLASSAMSKNLAFALMRHGIRVNQVNPGWMDTESEHRVQLHEENAPDDWLATLPEPPVTWAGWAIGGGSVCPSARRASSELACGDGADR
jgi:NAD(P)-dependent dehydrogenase (short-subunit alcohol dehydrogenase family)